MNITNVLKDHGVGIGKYGIGKTIQDYNLEELYYKKYVANFPQIKPLANEAIAMDKYNTIWFSDKESVIRIDSDGNQIVKFTYASVSKIIIYNDDIFVITHTGGLVDKCARFSSGGTKIWEITFDGRLSGFYCDEKTSYLYTSYYKSNYIYVIQIQASTGNYSTYATFSGSSHDDVSIRPNAYYYISGLYIFKKSLPSGVEQWSYPFDSYPGEIIVDKNGNVYTTSNRKLWKFDKDGNILWSTDLTGSNSWKNYMFEDYRGYIYTMGEYIISKVSPDGKIMWEFNTGKSLNQLVSNEEDYIYSMQDSNIVKYNFGYKVIS